MLDLWKNIDSVCKFSGSEVYSHNVLESCHVRNVPILQEKTVRLIVLIYN